MNLFFLHASTKDPKNGYPEHMEVVTNETPYNTTEGSEFLDDAIRMEEDPLINQNENAGLEE
jgi:hypothetical protein